MRIPALLPQNKKGFLAFADGEMFCTDENGIYLEDETTSVVDAAKGVFYYYRKGDYVSTSDKSYLPRSSVAASFALALLIYVSSKHAMHLGRELDAGA